MSPHDTLLRRLIVPSVLAFVVVILAATAVYLVREQRALPVPAKELTDAEKTALRTQATAPTQILLWGIGLSFGFLGLPYAFLRWSRHYRARLTSRPPPPTPVDDVWSLYRLPKENIDETSDATGDEDDDIAPGA